MSYIELKNIPSNTQDLTGIYNLKNGMKGIKGVLTNYEKLTLTPPGKDPNDLIKIHLDQRNLNDFLVVYKTQIKEVTLGSKKKSRRKSKSKKKRRSKRSRKR